MAALKHPYIEPKANISKAIKNSPQHHNHHPSTTTLSHNLAATTLKPSSTIFKAKQPTNNISPITNQNHPISTRQNEAPKTHDKGNEMQKEWIGCWWWIFSICHE